MDYTLNEIRYRGCGKIQKMKTYELARKILIFPQAHMLKNDEPLRFAAF